MLAADQRSHDYQQDHDSYLHFSGQGIWVQGYSVLFEITQLTVTKVGFTFHLCCLRGPSNAQHYLQPLNTKTSAKFPSFLLLRSISSLPSLL